MEAFCCHGNQSLDPICPKTLCSLSPTPVMLHIKFDQDWPTGFRDIQVWKCGRRTTTADDDDGRRTDDGPLVYYKLTLWVRLRWAKKIGSKTAEKRWQQRFPHYKSMGTFCCHGNQFWSNLPQNLLQPFLHPSDTTYNIWSRLANWLQRYSSLKVWTNDRRMTTDGRRNMVYYKLTLWAFGSGKLIKMRKYTRHP